MVTLSHPKTVCSLTFTRYVVACLSWKPTLCVQLRFWVQRAQKKREQLIKTIKEEFSSYYKGIRTLFHFPSAKCLPRHGRLCSLGTTTAHERTRRNNSKAKRRFVNICPWSLSGRLHSLPHRDQVLQNRVAAVAASDSTATENGTFTKPCQVSGRIKRRLHKHNQFRLHYL